MAREVVWTDPGWDDLEAAAAYIARDSEYYAASFVQEAREAAGSLAEFAERGQTVPEFGDESIREFLVKPYRLITRSLMNTFSSLRSFTAPSGCGESESCRIGPDNTALQTDERRTYLSMRVIGSKRRSRLSARIVMATPADDEYGEHE